MVPRDLKAKSVSAMVNVPSMFEPLMSYCNRSLFRIKGLNSGPRTQDKFAYTKKATRTSCTFSAQNINDHIEYHLKENSFDKNSAKHFTT